MNIKVAILGSCVTRDAFGYMDNVDIDFYLARNSLVSIYSGPWVFSASEDELQVEGKGAFENRMLRHDLRKEAPAIIREGGSLPLVVDFIDERFDLWLKGGSVITRSNLLQLTVYGRALDGARLLRRRDPEAMRLWQAAARRFLSDVCDRPLILHRALWAEHYRNDETGEILRFEKHDLEQVALHNSLLNAYYDFIEANHPDVRTVIPAPELVYSDFAHRWGRDFFHFSEDYYRDIASKIGQALTRRPSSRPAASLHMPSLADRDLIWSQQFSLAATPGNTPLDPARLGVGQGRVSVVDDHVCVDFDTAVDGAAVSHQLRLALPDKPMANGMGLRLRLRGWESISYVAIGHTETGTYHHAKATHPLQGEWFDFNIGFNDLAWGWRNGWQFPEERPIADIRFYIKGLPGKGAGCDLAEARVWREAAQPDAVFGASRPAPQSVMALLADYQRGYFPEYARQARSFLQTGQCPLAGGVLLDWPASEALPPRLGENGTFQYSWHSLHPAVLLLLLAGDGEATKTERRGAMFAARDLVADWLARSYEKPDPNVKYAWYDHGVAERLLAMIMLHQAGGTHGFDIRFMTRLSRAIHRHAQILASEIFYAGHQPIRYHNHAWFQDLALMATGLSFPGWACADLWIETALTRAADQFEKLIIRDGDFAVFAENSVGYHFGIGRLVGSIGEFAALSGRDTDISAIAVALERFSKLMRYPDGKRAPGQGDTFRIVNRPDGDPAGRKAIGARRIEILPRAGYAIVRGDHRDRPFMLCFFATSASSTHKHADNLSFTLYLDGIEWLIDPSFLSHEYTQPVPAYLRGPAAHNALVLPDAPYALGPGLAHLNGKERGKGGFDLEGSHSAVVGHVFRRHIKGAAKGLALEVTDWLESHDILPPETRLMFHCGEGVTAETVNGGVRLCHPASDLALVISLPAACRIEVIRGRDTDPVRGMAGSGFLQSMAIDTVEIIPPPGAARLIWNLEARSRDRLPVDPA